MVILQEVLLLLKIVFAMLGFVFQFYCVCGYMPFVNPNLSLAALSHVSLTSFILKKAVASLRPTPPNHSISSSRCRSSLPRLL